jgi:hypothetical protein
MITDKRVQAYLIHAVLGRLSSLTEEDAHAFGISVLNICGNNKLTELAELAEMGSLHRYR